MPRKAPTESRNYVYLKLQVEEDDWAILQSWAADQFRTPAGQAGYIIHELIERRRNGNGKPEGANPISLKPAS